MAKAIEQLVNKWEGVEFESSCGLTPEFAEFAKDFKKAIKASVKGAELVCFNRGHFYLSGFFKRGEKYVYFCTSDVRGYLAGWEEGLFCRTAENEKDFTGGPNHDCTILTLAEEIEKLLK